MMKCSLARAVKRGIQGIITWTLRVKSSPAKIALTFIALTFICSVCTAASTSTKKKQSHSAKKDVTENVRNRIVQMREAKKQSLKSKADAGNRSKKKKKKK